MSKHKPKNSKITNIELSDRFGLVYARVSSKRQEIEGTGLQSQEGRCKRFLESEHVKYEKGFLDSYSGGGDFLNRPAMRDLLSYIDSNPHKNYVVVFDDLSRFARDTVFHIKLRSEFSKRGVLLKCLNFNFEDSIEGKLIETIMAARNEYDRDTNRRQVIQKQKSRLENGYRSFPAVKGYQRVKDNVHGKIDVLTADAVYVKEALEGFASMRFVHKIDGARFLQENGVIKRKQTADKAIATYDKMLKEVFYAGYIEYEPWEVERRSGHHESLISLATFEKNQKRLNQRVATFVRQDIRDDFELRGLVNCSDCSTKLTGAPSTGKSGKKHNYYKCPNKGCAVYGKSIKAKDLHDRFDALLQQIRPSNEIVDLSVAIFEEEWDSEMSNRGKVKTTLFSKKTELEDEIDAISKRISKTTSEPVIRQYEKQIERLALELEDLEEKTEIKYDYTVPNRTAVDQVMQVLKSPYVVWKNYDVRQKQRFFNFIFEQNLAYNKIQGYRTPNYVIPIRVFEDILPSEPVDVEVGGVEPPCNKV